MRTELDDLYADITSYLAPHWVAGSINITPKVQGAIDFLTAIRQNATGPHAVPTSSGRLRLKVSQRES